MIKLQEAELWNSAVVQKICLDLWYCLFWKEQNGKTCHGRKHLLHFLDSCTFSCHTKWCWSNWCRLGCICVHILNQSLTGKILKVPDNIDIFIHTNMAKAVSIKNVQMQGLYYDFFFSAFYSNEKLQLEKLIVFLHRRKISREYIRRETSWSFYLLSKNPT